MTDSKRRTVVLANQLYPNAQKQSSAQNESAKFFQYVNQGVIFESRINVIHVREILSRIGKLLHEIYFLMEQDESPGQKPDFWTTITNV